MQWQRRDIADAGAMILGMTITTLGAIAIGLMILSAFGVPLKPF